MTERQDMNVEQLNAENDRLRAELVAAWVALEEMRWPDLPGIEFSVIPPIGSFHNENDHVVPNPQRVIVHPAKIENIYRALRIHAMKLLPTGVSMVQELNSLKSKKDNAVLEERAKVVEFLEKNASGFGGFSESIKNGEHLK